MRATFHGCARELVVFPIPVPKSGGLPTRNALPRAAMLYSEDLDDLIAMGCQGVHCPHGAGAHRDLVLACARHPGAGSMVSAVLHEGRVVVRCRECRAVSFDFAVAPRALTAALEPKPGDMAASVEWATDTLHVISHGFDVFSKRLRRRLENQHAGAHIAQNAILAGYLRKIVEYLRTTYYPETKFPAFREMTEQLEERIYERIMVMSNAHDVPIQKFDRENPRE